MSELKMLRFNDLERVQAKNRIPLFLNALQSMAQAPSKSVMARTVRRQSFWAKVDIKIAESLASIVVDIKRLVFGIASVGFAGSGF